MPGFVKRGGIWYARIWVIKVAKPCGVFEPPIARGSGEGREEVRGIAQRCDLDSLSIAGGPRQIYQGGAAR